MSLPRASFKLFKPLVRDQRAQATIFLIVAFVLGDRFLSAPPPLWRPVPWQGPHPPV